MISLRAITLFLLIMVERVFIIVLRGNICMFLKRDMNFLEMRAISIFHFFEFIVYFSAWVGGKFCLRYWKIVLTVQSSLLAIGIGLLIYGKDHLHLDDNLAHRALFTGAFAIVGISHGLQLTSTLRIMDTNIIRSKKMNAYFLLFLITDVGGFIGLTVLDDYMVIVYTGAVVLLCQVLVLAFFFTDKTVFDTYPGPFNELRVYVDTFFQHLVVYANENIETRKTFKETRKERKMRMIKELLMKRKKLLMTKQGPKAHYLDIVIPKYGLDYVNDVKLKWRMRSLFLLLPLVWIGIELQYSYWMLSVYRMDRVSFLKPPQLILAVNGIVNFFFLPIFMLGINSLLKYAKFNTGMHRMVIGGFFIVMAIFIGLNNINTQESKREKANEPYFSQVKQVVVNGINCNLSFNEKVHVEYQQSFGMKTPGPVHRITWKNSSTARKRAKRRVRRQSKVVSYDEYYESYDLDAFVFEWNWSTFFDTVIYYLDPKAKGQMLTVFPYDCKDRAPFDFQLNAKRSLDIVGLSEYDIVFIAPPDLSNPRILRVHHQREDESRPGLRFLVGNDTAVQNFKIFRGDDLVYSFPQLKNLSTDFYWFEPNDGPNLSFNMDGAMFKSKFVYRKGGLYNVVFAAHNSTINVMSIYYAEPPFSIHFAWALPQFIILAIGEMMFGMMGCQFFVEQTPQKLKYHTMLDWYWALAVSNVIILIFIHSGLIITFFFQVYWLSITVLISFCFFFYFTFRFPFVHLGPGDAPKLQAPVMSEEMTDATEGLPIVAVTVAADPEPAPEESPVAVTAPDEQQQAPPFAE